MSVRGKHFLNSIIVRAFAASERCLASEELSQAISDLKSLSIVRCFADVDFNQASVSCSLVCI